MSSIKSGAHAPAIITMPYKSLRTIYNPTLEQRGIKVSEIVVSVLDIPDTLAKWRDVNPRDPRTKGAVAQRIVRGMLEESPEIFSVKNRGLCIVCKGRKILSSTTKKGMENKIMIELEDPEIHGLIDGGSTYELIRQNVDAIAGLDFDQLIKIEIIEGLGRENEEMIVSIVEARNSSNQVKDKTLLNARGYFDPIREVLCDWSRCVAYSEYEVGGGEEDDCSVLVEDIVALLVCMDIQNFNKDQHPVTAYGSKRRLLEYYTQHKDTTLKPLFPLLKDMLLLYEELYYSFPTIYNKSGKGYFGSLPGVKSFKNGNGHRLPFSNRSSKYGIPMALLLPAFAAFRLLLRKKANGSYAWSEDPIKAVLKQRFGQCVIKTIGDLDRDANNVNGMAKDSKNWKIVYLEAEICLQESMR